MKSWLKILIVIFILVIGFLVFLNTSKNNSIRTMQCLDQGNISGKNDLQIPCLEDNDCNETKMIAFCSPAEVGFFKCGFKDFCGDDGYCKHDCSLG